MKKVVAYINTLRVHWVVDELKKIGIEDISVYQRFKPNSQISRLEFMCGVDNVDRVQSVIHTFGENGSVADHALEIFDP